MHKGVFVRWVAVVAAAFIAGLVAGILMPFEVVPSIMHEEREYGESYDFINPLLSCGEGNFNHLGNDETIALEKKLASFVETEKAAGRINDAGVYFRELNGGPWVGVDFEQQFTPGSLLKVPLAISVYQQAERDPLLLSRVIEYEGGDAGAPQFYEAARIMPGAYTVEELIRAMLVNSDNNAALLLAQVIGNEQLDSSYSHLGIKAPRFGSDYETSVRTYASFFRILYNSTYLDRAHSERMLSLLSETAFTDGIVAGVPAGTKVAHKFGERSLESEGTVQLHDCGIVYHPQQPYLLCVMMRGSDFTTIATAIAGISRLAYSSID